MSLTSGFYNAMLVNGEYDRKYNGDDYRNVFAAFLKDGVRRSGEDDFRVTASGLTLSVNLGYAICGGRWVRLDADYTLPALTAPVGSYSRRDAVILRVDENEAVREASLLVRAGTPSSNPTAPAKDTTTGVYELILATVLVAPGAASVTLTDTRGNANLCGWVTSPVGYDDYFKSLDASFEEWFTSKRDQLASVTLFKQYKWRTILEAAASSVTFDIPQYDATGVDIIQVYVNGLLEIEGVDYSLSGSTITFGTGGGGTGSKVSGTEIVVICYKSIDGTGLGSVSDEITELQNKVAALSTDAEYIYICNGEDDNVKLSELAVAWLGGGTDYASKIIRVYGTFGAASPYGGSGTEASPYIWMRVGQGAATNRKIVFDFSGCSHISIACPDDSHNIIFFGLHANIRGANVVATGGAAVYMFSTSGLTVSNAEDCRFWITSAAGYIARGGTFRDCRCSMTATGGDAYCFNVLATGLLRLIGGEYYAYAPTGSAGSVIYVNSAQEGAAVAAYGINCPTVARGGYVQTYAINCLTADACCSFTDTITALPITASGQNIRGTIAKSKPGLM